MILRDPSPSNVMLNICLVGAGGVGTIAAYALEKSRRAQVTAVLRSNYAVAREEGFDIDSVDHGNVRGWKPHDIVPSLPAAKKSGVIYHFIVLTTKVLPDTVSTLIQDLSPLITASRTSLVLIQNGLNIEIPFAKAFTDTPILSGVSMIGSRLTSPRTIFHEDPDQLKIGAYFHHLDHGLTRERQLDALQLFASVYNAGLADRSNTASSAQCIIVDDIIASRWRKLLWNASFNTLCTLLRVSVGELLRSPGRDTLLAPAMREIVAIATAAGYGDFVTWDVAKEMLEETPSDSPFRPSMLVDLDKGRPLELEAILGAPLSVGKEKGVATPVLSQVYSLLSVIQWGVVQGVRKT